MAAGSIHDVRPEAFAYTWDNSLAAAVEIDPGDEVVLHARDASDGQIRRDSVTGPQLTVPPGPSHEVPGTHICIGAART